MFDVTNFLLRWLFLSNLVRDIAELQHLPSRPFTAPPPNTSPRSTESQWQDHCARCILSYPPGPLRSQILDSFRTDLVQQLEDHIIQLEHERQLHRTQEHQQQNEGTLDRLQDSEEDIDPLRIRKAGEASPTLQEVAANVETKNRKRILEETLTGRQVDTKLDETEPSDTSLRHLRDYLPQLASAALQSPPPLLPTSPPCVHQLRQVLLRHCRNDPSWGMSLCWLLETKVGRAWKDLFEKQQQGGRLILLLLPAEKAAVVKQLGVSRREAFDFLQEAEQATAYGNLVEPSVGGQQQYSCQFLEPSSLKQMRCRHFGDAMFFIDSLTEISSHLRWVPVPHRTTVLHDRLQEVNRRLRRRMLSKGDISLDVEDQQNPCGWPQLQDLLLQYPTRSSVNLNAAAEYSIHLPLVPQAQHWPNGVDDVKTSDAPDEEAFRVLNIVVSESRLLSSRERCPYLVHVEVLETGLEADDVRLYSARSDAVASYEEAEGKAPNTKSTDATAYTKAIRGEGRQPGETSYASTPELFEESLMMQRVRHDMDKSHPRSLPRGTFPRGGSRQESIETYMDPFGGHYPDTSWSNLRQQELEALHQMMQDQPPPPRTASYLTPAFTENTFSRGRRLLDKVFGSPFSDKCKEIRSRSPFGHLKGWRLASFILKAGEDIRKEALVMQVISKLHHWFETEIPAHYRPFLRPYAISCVGGDAGLVECLPDAKSLDEIKKQTDGFTSLRDFFDRAYPRESSGYRPEGNDDVSFEKAQDNFLRSLVGYSLVCYILQVKDRHNANILMDRYGHIMHIDFGFVLGETPRMGKVPIFAERAPFKLSQDFWQVLGGWNSRSGGLAVRFMRMFESAFACASNHSDEIASLVEATMLSLDLAPNVARRIGNGVRSRLRAGGPPRSSAMQEFVTDIVNTALTSWQTSTYDWLQKNMNGYQ